MKKKYYEYLIILFLFLFIIIYDHFGIKDNIDYNKINGIYCNNINIDYNDYLNYVKNNQLLLSKVKYRDIYNYKHEFTIYKGFNDNLKVGLFVINNDGLIGVISKVYANTSIVRLITNKESKISIKINNNYGILKYDNELYIDDLVGDIKINDLVYTSGFGNIMENILIGKVSAIVENKKIIVDPIVSFNNVNYLYVIGDYSD